MKFIVLTDPKQTGMDSLLRKVYEIYADFALKNPFYSLDMPIRFVNIEVVLDELQVRKIAPSFGFSPWDDQAVFHSKVTQFGQGVGFGSC